MLLLFFVLLLDCLLSCLLDCLVDSLVSWSFAQSRFESIILAVFKPLKDIQLDSNETVLLAADLRVMLQTARRLRRSWKSIAKSAGLETGWPSATEKWPNCFKLIQMMQDPKDVRDEANMEPLEDSVDQEVEDLESIWPGAASAVEPESVLDRLVAKRKQVIQDLQGKSVFIDSDDEVGAQPDHKKIKMDPGEWGLPASTTSGASDPGSQAVLPMVEAPTALQPVPWIIWMLHSFHFSFFGNSRASISTCFGICSSPKGSCGCRSVC